MTWGDFGMAHGKVKKRLGKIIVRPRPGHPTAGWLDLGGMRFPCRLGRSGPRHAKREGDGATPIATMAIREVLYRADRGPRPTSPFVTRPIRSCDGWCDDAGHGRYNRPVTLPFPASHEEMNRPDRLYDVVVVLDWNVTRRMIGRGSAIFFHQTSVEGRPTAGCIAVAPAHMRRILPRLSRHATMTVI
jgi:L,D-peptidoglycan transpeptidase YkuD (ErfK/YbiS/YcfS/YnhG family)